MTTSSTGESAWYFAAFHLHPFLGAEDAVVYLDNDDNQMRGKGNEKDAKKGRKLVRWSKRIRN
jgi:hypothetical protein